MKQNRPHRLAATIYATIAGHIWQPCSLCWKDGIKLQFGHGPWKFGGTLRDAALSISNDGDFQSCSIVEGELVLERMKQTGTSTITRTRVFPLAFFPSIADCMASEAETEAYFDAVAARDSSDDDDSSDEEQEESM